MNSKITKGGVTIEVTPLTYMKDLQFRTLFRLGLQIKDELANLYQIDSDLVIALIHDYCLVSMRVQINHDITNLFISPTVNLDTFCERFISFADSLLDSEYAEIFDKIIHFVRELDHANTEDYQHPEKPDDPN